MISRLLSAFSIEPRVRRRSVADDGQSRRPPCLEATDDVRRSPESDQPKRGRCERGRVPFVTGHYPLDVKIPRFRDAPLALWMEAPFEMVPLNHDRRCNLTVGRRWYSAQSEAQ